MWCKHRNFMGPDYKTVSVVAWTAQESANSESREIILLTVVLKKKEPLSFIMEGGNNVFSQHLDLDELWCPLPPLQKSREYGFAALRREY